MKITIVNGDLLAGAVARIAPVTIICREAFVEGPIGGAGPDFWRAREEFAARCWNAPVDDYRRRVREEFQKVKGVADGAEIDLWFGDDLFCQVNMWFVIGLFGDRPARFFRIFPKLIDFGAESNEELRSAADGRVGLGGDGRRLAADLWSAFAAGDGARLLELSGEPVAGFRRLEEVCRAAAEIGTRPAESLRRIVAEVGDDFAAVFKEFSRREAIYGFGDKQVRSLLQNGSINSRG